MAAKLPSPDGRWSRRNAYAAIALGTNNCRLLIAKPPADGLIVVDASSRIVRLGEGLATNGGLCDAALDRAIPDLSVCARKLRRRTVPLASTVAHRSAEHTSDLTSLPRISYAT